MSLYPMGYDLELTAFGRMMSDYEVTLINDNSQFARLVRIVLADSEQCRSSMSHLKDPAKVWQQASFISHLPFPLSKWSTDS
jgi:hypothetical protein